MSPFFSICIPNFNYSKYLKLTIESVLAQSFQDFEIIVADNASTDNSVEMVKSFNDSRIRVVVNSINLGFTPNLDKCTEPAAGKYMILLSSDDIMLPNALEIFYNILNEESGEDIILMAACSVIDSEGRKIGSKRAMTGDVFNYFQKENIKPHKILKELKGEYYNSLDILKALLTGTFQPAGQFLATCYSSSLYKKLEGYRSIMSVHADAHFSQRMLFQNPKVVYINQELFGYRVHNLNNNSATVNMANIKYLTDSYLLTKQYDTKQLNEIGLNPETLELAYINNMILRDSYWALIRGNTLKGMRLIFLGFAAYPKHLQFNWKFYLQLLFILFSPISGLIYRIIKIFRNNKQLNHAV
jgi:glycosyltransferase involved in cell wall biosynthesis